MARTRKITVKVGTVGGDVKEVLLNLGDTVEDALEAARHTLVSGEEVFIDDEVVGMDHELEADDIIAIGPKVKDGV
jgi:ribosome-interacting GTPase 1